MKKFTAVLLSVVMLLSVLCVPALAAGQTNCLWAEVATDGNNETVTVTFYAKEATTNGRFTVEYDADRLTPTSVEVEGTLTKVTEDEGSVTVGYASLAANAIAKNGVVATFTFDITGIWTKSDLTVTVAEFNDREGMNAALATITVIVYIPSYDDADEPGDEEETGGGEETPGLTDEVYEEILDQYSDVKDHWAEEYIVKAVNAGLFNGTSETTFTPDGIVTRGMFATLLYRLHGKPAVSGDMPFADVAADMYYYDAVLWAYNSQVVNGISDTEFAPEAQMTREQMVAMLYRYAGYAGKDTTAAAGLGSFGDADQVSAWALDAMSWAVAEGVINGIDGNLCPAEKTTRGQIAAVLVRYAGL